MSVRRLALGLLLLSACERDEALFVTRVYPAEQLPDGVSADVATASVEKALKERGFILAEGSSRNFAAKFNVHRETGDDHWTLRLLLTPRDGGLESAVPMEGLGTVPVDEAVPTPAQLAIAASAAARELQDERRLMRKPKEEVKKALQGDDRRILHFAIRLAGARKMKDMVPVLCERLQTEPDGELALRIVGALVQIADTRAVSTLVAMTKRKHPIFINQIVFAVAQIGGQEAEAYLDTLAQGHPSDQVRQAAKEALQELLSRKTAPRVGAESIRAKTRWSRPGE